MGYYRELLEKQIGHLRNGAPAWYTEGSPCAGIDLAYVGYAEKFLPLRFRWLVDECRAKGYKRVAEYGSIEGVSLFHLIQHAPDIEWHGFEANSAAVARGHELAREAGLSAKFHLERLGAPSSRPGVFPHRSWALPSTVAHFDAVALFEVLEHNNEEEGAAVLHEAETLVRPGGEVFITTPCGNWSAWDEKTRVLELRKDHVNAFTPVRMTKFLLSHSRMVPSTLEVRRVENPSLHENNSWVFARFRLPG